MNKTIEKLRKEHKKDFQEYEKSLYEQHVNDVKDSLDMLLSIRGITGKEGE